MSPAELRSAVTPDSRNWPAKAKLACPLAIIVAVILMPRRPHPIFLAPAVILLGGWYLCRMPLWVGIRRLLVAEFFVLGLAVLSAFDPASRPLMLATIIKSNLCVLALLLLTWTTPFQELLLLLKHWGVPSVMVTTLTLMCRYLPVMNEELRRMQRARTSRTFAQNRRLQWTTLSDVVGRLFIRTTDRAEHIYLAMCSRGWK
jgi:cobalt/nickel transport system permease protein